MAMNFSKMEEEILAFWEKNKIFEKTLSKKAPKGDYVFYDGPPFATGTPHYGHIVASLIKDAVPRYWTMNGYRVERKWGWDCHGLPIENIVEKEVGLKSKKDIEEKMGVEKFNEACRSKVLMYADEWKKFIPRMGRWVDMENAYRTMDVDYMESIWWAFKQLWDKGLIYEGHKAMHICPRCETTLSQSEVSQGYKTIQDISVIIKFPIADKDFLDKYCDGKPTSFLAWTTTPWSVPTTMGLAMDKDADYLIIKIDDEQFVVVKERLEYIKGFCGTSSFVEIGKIKGELMVGISYKHPFSQYYEDHPKVKNNANVFKTYPVDYINKEDGTGIVTINGAFGEIDMASAKKFNLPIIINVKTDGTFTEEMGEFAGVNVKPIDDVKRTDAKVVEYLKNHNAIFASEEYEHSYPHCWRCDTPLLNYATSSWFVSVTKIKEQMLDLAKKINWMPTHLKEGRFGNWLEGAEDWSISRQRFWGSVLPIWQCDKCKEVKVFGSREELKTASGHEAKDLHKHFVDKIVFSCDKCDGMMRRVPDVLDCWFESGSMPYAQLHYPFENKEKFENNFPAEFIGEGVDQTRCWFYYLLVLSTALKNNAPFLNVIANGIVLAEDGQKMSKRLKNYPDPNEVINKYSADALRYYLLTSPVMKADTLCFAERGVEDVSKKLMMILWNVLLFYKMYAKEKSEAKSQKLKAKNILDQWILAKLNLLIKNITKQMNDYDLVQASRPIVDFVNELSTWWLRRSRDRFKGEENEQEQALDVLRFTLLILSKLIAPFTPFMAEKIYQEVGGEKESVHLESWPKVDEKLLDEKVLREMEVARKIVEMAHALRAEAGIKVRQPLSLLQIQGAQIELELLEIILDEVNVKKGEVVEQLEQKDGYIIKSEGAFGVGLCVVIDEELKKEGLLRELTRQINGLRKEAGLKIIDQVDVLLFTDDKLIKVVVKEQGEELRKSVVGKSVKLVKAKTEAKWQSEFEIDNASLWVGLNL